MIGFGQLVPIIPTTSQLNAQVAPLASAQAAAAGMAPVLTNANLAAPIPDITQVPLDVAPDWSTCDWWEKLNGEIELHPWIATGILLLAWGTLYHGGRTVRKYRARKKTK